MPYIPYPVRLPVTMAIVAVFVAAFYAAGIINLKKNETAQAQNTQNVCAINSHTFADRALGTGALPELQLHHLPDDVADPPLDERARNAMLDASTLTQAWYDTLADEAGDQPSQWQQHAMWLATNARRQVAMALITLEQARQATHSNPCSTP